MILPIIVSKVTSSRMLSFNQNTRRASKKELIYAGFLKLLSSIRREIFPIATLRQIIIIQSPRVKVFPHMVICVID